MSFLRSSTSYKESHENDLKLFMLPLLIFLINPIESSGYKYLIIARAMAVKNMISHLNEMISMVLLIFEYGDSESKMGLKKFTSISRD